MSKLTTTIALALGLSTAHAGEVEPLAAQRITLGTMEGVAYYSAESDGLRLVATFVERPTGKPIRMIATLSAGQSIQFVVPGDVDEAEEIVEFMREGDVLVLRDPVDPLSASID